MSPEVTTSFLAENGIYDEMKPGWRELILYHIELAKYFTFHKE